MNARAASLVVSVALLASVACAPTVYGYAVDYPDHVPPLSGAPRVYFHANYAYLIADRWYYPSASGWVVFLEEPPELHNYGIARPH